MPPKSPSQERPTGMVAFLTDTFGFSTALASVVAALMAFVGLVVVVWVVRSAPPRTLTLSGGRPGSSFQWFAESYKKALALHGVELRIEPSGGSEENLRRLESKESGVDIGFVQGGLAENENVSQLVSLGSVAYEPLWIFYSGPAPMSRLSQLEGKRIALGIPGSGTHELALKLLKANGITGEPTKLINLDAEQSAKGLLDGSLDAVFLMGDSASIQTLRSLLVAPNVQLYSFSQADAYVRRFNFLNRMVLPEGSIDLGKDLPARDVALVGPTVELVARSDLNSALSDLVLEVAQQVHGRAGLLQKRGEFPAPLEHEFRISEDALRFYKSGKGYIYRAVGSFWLASLVNRLLVVLVPLLILLIPAVRFFPNAYRWTIQIRFYQCYRRLLHVERDITDKLTPEDQKALLTRIDEIELAVSRLKVPAYLADQFYGLKGHITFVRGRLRGAAA